MLKVFLYQSDTSDENKEILKVKIDLQKEDRDDLTKVLAKVFGTIEFNTVDDLWFQRWGKLSNTSKELMAMLRTKYNMKAETILWEAEHTDKLLHNLLTTKTHFFVAPKAVNCMLVFTFTY